MALERKSLPTPASEPQTTEFKTVLDRAFFAPKKAIVPTLQELTCITLIEQLGSVESVEDHINQNRTEDSPDESYNYILSILTKIKTLHRLVLENNLEAVAEFLNATPYLLLPVLLKTKSINKTSAKGISNHIVVEGTALMMAIGAEAFGRDGCDLCLIASHAQKENTTIKTLALYSDDDPDSPLRYRVESKEFIIGYGSHKEQLNLYDFNTLKAMLKNPSFHNKNLNFNNLELPEQRLAYKALLEITQKRTHTAFTKGKYHDIGMVELLQHHIQRTFPTEGEREIEQQTLQQLPEGWEEMEEKQYQADLVAVQQIRKAIQDSTSEQDPKLTTALETFRNYFEPDAKEIIRTGRYGKNRLLSTALEIGCREYVSRLSNYKDKVWFDLIIGWLQRLAQDNVKHDMAQGLYFIERGINSKHRLQCTFGDGHFGHSEIGFDSYRDLYEGHQLDNNSKDSGEVCVPGNMDSFQKLYANKNAAITKIYTAAKHSAEARQSMQPNLNRS